MNYNLRKCVWLLAFFTIFSIPFVFAVKAGAKTNTAAKAKRAYAKYLTKSTQDWGEYHVLDTSQCKFALKDFNNDGVPELVLLKIVHQFRKVLSEYTDIGMEKLKNFLMFTPEGLKRNILDY